MSSSIERRVEKNEAGKKLNSKQLTRSFIGKRRRKSQQNSTEVYIV
jgi:hypothetical protein